MRLSNAHCVYIYVYIFVYILGTINLYVCMKSCESGTQWCDYLHVIATIIPWKLTWTPQVKSDVAEKNNTMITGCSERLSPVAEQCRGFRVDGLCMADRKCPGIRFEGRNCHWWYAGTVLHKRDGIWFGRVRWWRWLWYLYCDNNTDLY